MDGHECLWNVRCYGTLVAWANALGRDDVATILEDILNEEKGADEKLAGLAEGGINQNAADAGDAEGEDGEMGSEPPVIETARGSSAAKTTGGGAAKRVVKRR